MLNNLKNKLFKSIKSKKLNVFLFFLVLSFLFLVVTKLSKIYTETITFHIKYENVPIQHSINTDVDSIVKVKVRTYGFNLLPHNFYRHTILVNFNKEVRKNGQNYIWKSERGFSKIEDQLGPKFEVISIEPDSLNFPYEVMTVKKVPIKFDRDITFAPGYDVLNTIDINPDSINVIGPKKSVEKIKHVKTDKLILKDLNETFKKQVKIVLDPSIENIKLSENNTVVSAIVTKFTEGTFEVPITIINLPANVKINYFPKTIPVSYYVSLENYNAIKVLDFKIICDYEKVKNDERTYFSPQLIEKPDLVKSAKMKQNKIDFIITE